MLISTEFGRLTAQGVSELTHSGAQRLWRELWPDGPEPPDHSFDIQDMILEKLGRERLQPKFPSFPDALSEDHFVLAAFAALGRNGATAQEILEWIRNTRKLTGIRFRSISHVNLGIERLKAMGWEFEIRRRKFHLKNIHYLNQ